MILEYSYEKMNQIIDLFNKNELASLVIKSDLLEEKTVYIIEYTLISDYDAKEQAAMKIIYDNSLSQRLSVVKMLNEFLEMMSLNKVNSFYLLFNTVQVRKCEIDYSYSYIPVSIEHKNTPIEEIEDYLKGIEKVLLQTGASNQKIPNVFKKEGTGKAKKQTQLTMQELVDTLRFELVIK